MAVYCIECKSIKIKEIVEETQVVYFCESCKHKSGRAFIVDGRIKIINTSRGIKHIAVAAIVLKDHHILLSHRRTHPYGYEIPAGHVEYDERLEQAIKRELFEEVGIKAQEVTLLSQIEHPVSYCRYGSDIEEWAVFLVERNGQEGYVNNNENDGLLWAPLDQLPIKELTPMTLYCLQALGYATKTGEI